MPLEQLGQPLTSVHSIPGGPGRLYERGLTVNGTSGEVVVSFAFPMIGRPSIVMGTAAPMSPIGADAITFKPGNWQLGPLTALIQSALAGRLALLPTRQPTGQVGLTIGTASLVVPEQLPGSGGAIPTLYGPSVTGPALQERRLYDVAVRGDAGWRIVAPHAVYHRRTWTD